MRSTVSCTESRHTHMSFLKWAAADDDAMLLTRARRSCPQIRACRKRPFGMRFLLRMLTGCPYSSKHVRRILAAPPARPTPFPLAIFRVACVSPLVNPSTPRGESCTGYPSRKRLFSFAAASIITHARLALLIVLMRGAIRSNA